MLNLLGLLELCLQVAIQRCLRVIPVAEVTHLPVDLFSPLLAAVGEEREVWRWLGGLQIGRVHGVPQWVLSAAHYTLNYTCDYARYDRGWCNGSTRDFGSLSRGSNPRPRTSAAGCSWCSRGCSRV